MLAPFVLTYSNFVVLIIMSWLVSTVCGSIRLRPGPSRCVRYYWASARCWSASSLAPCSWSPGSGSGSRVSLKFNGFNYCQLLSSMSDECFLPIIAFNFLISEFCSSTLLCSFSVDSPTSLLHSSSTIDCKEVVVKNKNCSVWLFAILDSFLVILMSKKKI